MDIKKILLVALIAVAIVASVSAVSAGLFDGLFGEEQKDNVVEIDNITFNTTNVTEFKLENETNEDGMSYKYYFDKNGTGYNVWIYDLNEVDNSVWVEFVKLFKQDTYDNVPCETVNGVVVYTTSAAHGEHVGEPRYESYVENSDLNTIVRFATPDPNETAKMTLSLKFK